MGQLDKNKRGDDNDDDDDDDYYYSPFWILVGKN